MLAQVANKQVVASTGSSLVHKHQGFLFVDTQFVETLGLCGILVEQYILRLGSTHLVIVNLHALVDMRELLAFFRTIVGRIVETVTLPCCTRELCPLNMVTGELTGLQVDDIEFLPVGTATGDAVSCPLAVVGEIDTFQGYRTIGAQRVWIQEYARLTAQLVHLIEHTLVLQTVVLVEVPLAVALAWCTNLLVVGQLGESVEQLLAEGNLLQVGVGHLVFGCHPGSSLCRGVIF